MTADPPMSLRALVTAAGGGAGQVITERLLSVGARVVACDVATAGLDDLRVAHEGLAVLQGDAADEGSVHAAFQAVRDHLGGIDVLVNNVGIAGPTAAVENVSLDQWNETMRVNLTSHFLFARAAIPLMKAQGSGLIVNISSGSAKVGLPLRLPYVVSKGAVLSLTMNLARELGPFGIRVNAILPGPIRGARIQRIIEAKAEAMGIPPEDYERSMLRFTSMRTMVEPDDVAAAIMFLSSEGGRRVSGQFLGVDGNLEWEE